MLHIQLTDGREFQLETISPVALKNEGTYGNGSIDWEDEGLYLYDIAAQIGVKDALAAFVNGELVSLNTFIKRDSTLQYVMAEDEAGKAMIDRTTLFLLAYGIKSLERSSKRVQGVVENGTVYYDFLLEGTPLFSAEELQQAETYIAKAIDANYPAGSRKFPYYSSKKELLNAGETYLLQYIDAHDDYGPVVMQVMEHFADPDHGLMLSDFSILEKIHLTQTQVGESCRISATAVLK